ncbi:MAG: hypothetical protein WCK31_03205 [bacterium]
MEKEYIFPLDPVELSLKKLGTTHAIRYALIYNLMAHCHYHNNKANDLINQGLKSGRLEYYEINEFGDKTIGIAKKVEPISSL